MATLRELKQAALDDARNVLANAQSEVTKLEGEMAALPVEIADIAEETWAKIKAFLGVS